ncbi:MAG: hypothetical protein AAB215_00185 [Planctomycetota bacterium]
MSEPDNGAPKTEPSQPAKKGLTLLEAVLLLALLATAIVVSIRQMRLADDRMRAEGGPLVTLDCAGDDIREVLGTLARIGRKNLVLAPDVQGKVTMLLRNVPWEEAFRTVTANYGHVTVRTSKPDGLYVVTHKTLVRSLQTRTYPLKFVRPPGPYRARKPSDIASSGSSLDPNSGSPKQGFPLFRAIAAELSPAGTANFDQDSNAFIVTDIPDALDRIGCLVESADRP